MSALNVVAMAEEGQSEELLAYPPWAYGVIALVVFAVLLYVVTRLDLDR